MTGKVSDQDEFALQVITDVNSAALTLQATIRAQINSERTENENIAVQRKVSRSARRLRKNKRRKQEEDPQPQGTSGQHWAVRPKEYNM